MLNNTKKEHESHSSNFNVLKDIRDLEGESKANNLDFSGRSAILSQRLIVLIIFDFPKEIKHSPSDLTKQVISLHRANRSDILAENLPVNSVPVPLLVSCCQSNRRWSCRRSSQLASRFLRLTQFLLSTPIVRNEGLLI
jgi:hypothetical protein